MSLRVGLFMSEIFRGSFEISRMNVMDNCSVFWNIHRFSYSLRFRFINGAIWLWMKFVYALKEHVGFLWMSIVINGQESSVHKRSYFQKLLIIHNLVESEIYLNLIFCMDQKNIATFRWHMLFHNDIINYHLH